MMAVDYSFRESYLHPTGVPFYEAKVGNRLFLSTGIPLYTNYFHLALVIVLIMGTPNKVPLILGNPNPYNPLYNHSFHLIFHVLLHLILDCKMGSKRQSLDPTQGLQCSSFLGLSCFLGKGL